ncbi:MAG: hypothetical protein AB1424_06205 [Thermodesulfobacteriota bacterium]
MAIRLLLAALALLALNSGCATGQHYQTTDQYEPYITDVPPEFYDYDPTLRHWFTAPYWNPNTHK